MIIEVQIFTKIRINYEKNIANYIVFKKHNSYKFY